MSARRNRQIRTGRRPQSAGSHRPSPASERTTAQSSPSTNTNCRLVISGEPASGKTAACQLAALLVLRSPSNLVFRVASDDESARNTLRRLFHAMAASPTEGRNS
jgi:hypothetical protein